MSQPRKVRCPKCRKVFTPKASAARLLANRRNAKLGGRPRKER